MDVEKTILKPQPGPQTEFLRTSADIAIFGGSAGCGKSWALLYEPMRHRLIPGFSAVIFRRTYPQITHPGGLWEEAGSLYSLLNAVPKGMSWTFPPANSMVTFSHLQLETDKYNWHGAQIPLIEWDELTHFTESQFWYLLSRNRSMCGVSPYVRATCNADAGSWVRGLVDWWIAPDGYADLAKAGQLRWFIRDGDALVWADTPAELSTKFPGLQPKSLTFIPASLYHNKILMEKDPGYLANLQSLREVERKRLLGDAVRGGNWNVKVDTKFRREWFEILAEPPAKLDMVCRYWDMAATSPKEGADPDWTVGAKVGVKDGIWYILDIRRDRLSPQKTEQMIKTTAILDGINQPVRMEEEGGSSGKTVIAHYLRNVLPGFNFAGIRSDGSKEVRAIPFAAAAEAGNVNIVNGPWVQAFLDELEAFSPSCQHDDQVDAVSGAFNFLASQILKPSIYAGEAQTTGNAGRALSRCDDDIEKVIAEIEKNGTPEQKLAAHAMLKQEGLR